MTVTLTMHKKLQSLIRFC